MSDTNKAWGILDESSDLHRALAMSDALIGDASSIAVLYDSTGKPALFLDIELIDEISKEERVEYLHSDIIGFTFGPDGKPSEWGFSATCNALYKIDVKNATAEYVSSVPREKNMPGVYYYPIKIENKLFLSPAKARSFAIYNIDTEEWTKTPVPAEVASVGDTRPVFGVAMHCGEYLLIRPGAKGVFAKYDFESDEFSFYDHWFNKFKHNIVDINRSLLYGDCVFDGKIYLTSPQCNIVTELCPNDMSFKFHKVGEKENNYGGITRTKDAFWLIKYPAMGQKELCKELVEWNPDTGKCVLHTNLPVTQDESRTGRAFSYIITVDDEVCIFPWHSDNIIKFDTMTKKGETLQLRPEFDFFKSKGKHYIFGRGIAMLWVDQEDNGAYFQSPTDYSLIKIDLKTGEYKKKKWRVTGAEHLLAKICMPDSVQFTSRYDTELYSLDHFLDDLVSGELSAIDIEKRDYYRSLIANIDGTAGRKIYEYVKRLVR